MTNADDNMRRVVKAREAYGWWALALACGHVKLGVRARFTTYSVRKKPPVRVFCRACAGIKVHKQKGEV
jgi:hypothetical protein